MRGLGLRGRVGERLRDRFATCPARIRRCFTGRGLFADPKVAASVRQTAERGVACGEDRRPRRVRASVACGNPGQGVQRHDPTVSVHNVARVTTRHAAVRHLHP
jgi:hypothetical protein